MTITLAPEEKACCHNGDTTKSLEVDAEKVHESTASGKNVPEFKMDSERIPEFTDCSEKVPSDGAAKKLNNTNQEMLGRGVADSPHSRKSPAESVVAPTRNGSPPHPTLISSTNTSWTIGNPTFPSTDTFLPFPHDAPNLSSIPPFAWGDFGVQHGVGVWNGGPFPTTEPLSQQGLSSMALISNVQDSQVPAPSTNKTAHSMPQYMQVPLPPSSNLPSAGSFIGAVSPEYIQGMSFGMQSPCNLPASTQYGTWLETTANSTF